MGVSHPISGRKARAAIGASLQATQLHNSAIRELDARTQSLRSDVGMLFSVLERGFFGRLKWLLFGK